MEKFKDIIYDKSDILIALIIVALAGLIIWFSVNNIMKPVEVKADAQTQVEEVTTDEATDIPVTGEAEGPESVSIETGTPASIIIQPGEDSNQIAEKLLAAGAISDKNEFYAKLEELGLASRIQEGTFEIPYGSTLDVVCKIITKTN